MNKLLLSFKLLISKKNSLILAILMLASFLRLYRIADYLTFLGDEGRDVLKAYEILHGQLTLLGPTSSVGGFFLGPIYYYFMAPFLWIFNYNPVGPAIMVALIGVFTVFLIYKFLSDLFDYRLGLIAAFFYAISPLVIAYSRSSWNPNPLPFFSLLSLYTLYKAVVSKNIKLFFASGFLLGISMQLHYLAIFLGVVMFSYILLSEILNNKLNFKNTKKILINGVAVVLGFGFGWIPFLAFELRHDFLNFRKIFDFIIHSGNTGANANFFQTLYDVFFRIFGRLLVSFPPPEQFSKFSPLLLNLWIGLVLFIGISSIAYLVFNLYKTYKLKNKNFNKYLLLFLWFFVGLFLFSLYKKSIYDYYFSFMFPLPFILYSMVLLFVFEKKNILLKGITVLIFLLLFVLNIQGLPFRYEPNRQLNQMKTIADFVMTRTNAKPFNFALITGGNSDHAYRYFFTTWNNPPKIIEDPARDPQRNSVTDQLFVVCESLPCQPLGDSLWEIAGFGRAEIVDHWKVSVVEIYKLVHYKGK